MKYKIVASLLTTLTIAEYLQEQTAEELAYRDRLSELVLEGNHATALSMADSSPADDSNDIRNFNMLGAIVLLSVAMATLIILRYFTDKERR